LPCTPFVDCAHLFTNYGNIYGDYTNFFANYAHNSDDYVNTLDDSMNIITNSTNMFDISSLDLCILHFVIIVHLQIENKDCVHHWICNAPPRSLMDSITSPKVKTMKGGVRACSPIRNTSGVKKHARIPGWD
jgi:hypothetical protein